MFNATDNIRRYREDRELSTREFTTCRNAEGLVAALDVAKKTEIDSTSGTRGHGIDRVFFLMNLRIYSEGETTVRFVVYCHASENSTRTKHCR